MTGYSQHNEDEFISDYFKDVTAGFFVDIGANDGIKGSNTRHLYDKGWSGVCVEPAPDTFEALKSNYAGQDRVRVVHAAVTDTFGQIPFYQHASIDLCGWNSCHQRWVKLWDEGTFKEVTVQSLRLQDLGLPEHFEFLSVDTEGSDLVILQTLNDSVQPNLICAEIDKFDYGKQIRDCLEAKGYKHLIDIEGNGFYERL